VLLAAVAVGCGPAGHRDVDFAASGLDAEAPIANTAGPATPAVVADTPVFVPSASVDAAPPAPRLDAASAPPPVSAPDAAVTPRVAAPDSGVAAAGLQSGLVGYWKFDDGRPDQAVDSSPVGNHGGLKNFVAADIKPGKSGSALLFTPARRTYVSVPNYFAENPPAGITVAAWINPTDTGGSRRIVQKGDADDQYRLLVEGGQLRFQVQTGSRNAVAAAAPAVGQWVHVAGTYDGRTLRLFVGGVAVASQAATGAIAVTSGNLHVGTRTAASTVDTEFWSGLIDEVMLYDRALNDAELRGLASGSTP
jgi:hypothetical protein